MIHPPKAATPRRTPRRRGAETSAGPVVAIVPAPPRAPEPAARVGGAGRGAYPRRAAGGFFRDPDDVRALGGLIPSLFAGKGPDQAVRVWVAGCGAGEEAWSIAILLAEHAATLPHPASWQIFATDTDAVACARARNALYLASTVAGVPAARLGRFFTWEGGGYRVAGPLRADVRFSTHDVLRDAPFERLDLVSCRGLLAVLPADERARVIETFRGALRPGGVLFLGPGESPGDGAGFGPAADAHPVYRRDAAPAPDLPGGAVLVHAAAGSAT